MFGTASKGQEVGLILIKQYNSDYHHALAG